MKITRPTLPPLKKVKDLVPGTVFEVIGGLRGHNHVLMRLMGTRQDIGVPCVNLSTGERVDIMPDAPAEVLDAELVIH